MSIQNSLNIYVASSWRNKYQPQIVAALRAEGHEVYDFKNPKPGNDGFRWTEIDPNWENWTVADYARALEHPVAQEGFKLDLAAVIRADLCVLVLPSGRSASWEYGCHNGMSGRSGIVHIPFEEKCEPELMYTGSVFTSTLPQLLEAVDAYAAKLHHHEKIEAYFEMLLAAREAIGAGTEEASALMGVLAASQADIEAILDKMEKAAEAKELGR